MKPIGRFRRVWIILGALALAACTAVGTPSATSTPFPTPRLEDIETALAGTLTALPSRTAPPAPPSATLPPTETPSLPSPIPPSAAPPTATASASPSPAPVTPGAPDEVILILEPGLTSRVISPVHVAGMANPTFEQNLVVQVFGEDGSLIVQTPTTIGSDAGTRGPFAIDVAFTVAAEQPGRIVVYSDSPRDGGLVHLASVEVTLLTAGPANILPGATHAEEIVIAEPALTATISGGTVHVSGTAGPTFESNIVIEVLDANGIVVGSAPTIIAAPDVGQPGPFSADIPYVVTSEQPGRIIVYHTSARDGGLLHLASVEITLAP